MAVTAEEMTKLTFRKYEDYPREEGQHNYDWDEYIWQSSWSHKCPTYVHQTPPCQGSCPAGEDIRGWLDIVRGLEKPPADMTMQEYAFRRSTNANPFPSVMGRVCPAPCEDGCNRNAVEDHVGINSVEQYIGDTAIANGFVFDAPPPETGKRIAIVGAGPAGLAAAYQLRRLGHGAVIFDEHEDLGGMMRYGIPGYRTPRDVLDAEIKRITDMGVEIHTNTRVGTDIDVETLEQEYDAILWAIGAQSGRALPIEGGDASNCVSGVAFLRAFNEGRLQHVTGKVVVVGGGDTSIDVASVARRLGHISVENARDLPESVVLGYAAHDAASLAARQGAEVLLISRQPLEGMNASQQEIDDALREGVTIRGSLNPVEVVLGEDGRAVGLKVAQLDYSSGKAEVVEGSEEILEANLIVSAIGQSGDFTGYEDLNNGRGLIDATNNYEVKGKPGHFVAGDIIRPHLLTTAIGHGSIVVDTINTWLNKGDLTKRPKVDVHHFNLLDKLKEADLAPVEFKSNGKTIDDGLRGTSEERYAVHNYEDRSFASIIPHDELFLGHFSYTPRNLRDHKEVSADSVLQNFEERIIALSEEQAVAEAKRCMSCGMCFECDNCVVYCPQDAVFRVNKKESTTGRYVDTDYTKCVGCHICAEVCPTGYIQMGLGD